MMLVNPRSHPWRSKGEKRTICWTYEPGGTLLNYLKDMQDAIRYALVQAYRDFVKDGSLPSPIQVRKEIRTWFYSRYTYARHHINPVCRAAVAMLRARRKNMVGKLRIPQVSRLAMRIDGELLKIVKGRIRITLQPFVYAWIAINTKNKHYGNYATNRPTELLITDRKICLTFAIAKAKTLGSKFVAVDLNFRTIDSTLASLESAKTRLQNVKTDSIERIAQVQNDFSRRRRAVQLHVKNPQKRDKKLRQTRARQANRIRDALHKMSTKMVREHPDASFIFENLKGIRKESAKPRGKRFRTYLNRWPYRLYQSMIDYKSPNRTIFVNPRGTSSECPVCGGKVEHPTWSLSRCVNCGADYDRDRLASLAILCRGLRLCGHPFAVSADASWHHLRNEYLETSEEPDVSGPGRTDHGANAPNEVVLEHAPQKRLKS